MSKTEFPLIIVASTLVACVLVPAFRDNTAVIAPVAINAVVVLSVSRNEDDEDDDDNDEKRHR